MKTSTFNIKYEEQTRLSVRTANRLFSQVFSFTLLPVLLNKHWLLLFPNVKLTFSLMCVYQSSLLNLLLGPECRMYPGTKDALQHWLANGLVRTLLLVSKFLQSASLKIQNPCRWGGTFRVYEKMCITQIVLAFQNCTKINIFTTSKNMYLWSKKTDKSTHTHAEGSESQLTHSHLLDHAPNALTAGAKGYRKPEARISMSLPFEWQTPNSLSSQLPPREGLNGRKEPRDSNMWQNVSTPLAKRLPAPPKEVCI